MKGKKKGEARVFWGRTGRIREFAVVISGGSAVWRRRWRQHMHQRKFLLGSVTEAELPGNMDLV